MLGMHFTDVVIVREILGMTNAWQNKTLQFSVSVTGAMSWISID